MASIATQSVASGTNFLATIIIGRLAGKSELGTYVLGLTVVLLMIAAQNSLVSTPYTFFRQRAEGLGTAAYAGGTLIHHGVLSALGALGLGVAGVILGLGSGFSQAVSLVIVVACILPFVLLNQFARGFSYAHHDVGRVLRIDMAVGALQISGLVSLGLADRLTALTAFGTLGAASGLVGITWFFVSRRGLSLDSETARRMLDRHWRFGRWDLLAVLAGYAQLYGVYWLLMLNGGSEAIGILAASFALVGVLNPLLAGVGNVLAPRVADAKARHGDAELWRVVRKAAILGVSLLAAPVALLALVGGSLMELLYGNGYGGQGATVAIIALSRLAWWGVVAANSGLGALERSDTYFASKFVSLALTMGLGLPLIAMFGLPGAAAAMAVGGAVEAAINWVVLRRCVDLSEVRTA